MKARKSTPSEASQGRKAGVTVRFTIDNEDVISVSVASPSPPGLNPDLQGQRQDHAPFRNYKTNSPLDETVGLPVKKLSKRDAKSADRPYEMGPRVGAKAACPMHLNER